MPTFPSFDYEAQYWQAGLTLIAGVDEVGMGALAGPVVAAATIFRARNDQFPSRRQILRASLRTAQQGYGRQAIPNSQIRIRDSKTLSEKQRNAADVWIREHALAWAVGEASVNEIERLNIRGAAHLAMRRAVDALGQVPEMLLIDGTSAQVHAMIPAVNIVKGDSLSFSIAAASIVAKVHRDAIMVELDAEFPMYGFAGHKGYGAKRHLEALQEHGASPHHRASYAPVAAVLS